MKLGDGVHDGEVSGVAYVWRVGVVKGGEGISVSIGDKSEGVASGSDLGGEYEGLVDFRDGGYEPLRSRATRGELGAEKEWGEPLQVLIHLLSPTNLFSFVL